MLEIKNIHKSFSDFSFQSILKRKNRINQVLDGVNLSIKKGQIIGLKGANGSGKSTLLKIICNSISQDTGLIEIKDKKYRISMITTNDRSFFWRLTAKENLIFFGTLYGIKRETLEKRIRILSKELLCENILRQQFMFLSSGQRKKLMILRALLKNPEIILCDEITSNLDQETRELVINYFSNHLKQNCAIIWVSHIDQELREICDKTFELLNGKLFLSDAD